MSVRKVLSMLALSTCITCAVSMNGQAPTANDFAYAGDTGPSYWWQIKQEYQECAASPMGRQSPINIDNAVEDPTLRPLSLMLGPTPFTLTDPGYTVLATSSYGGTLVLDGLTYTIQQFHFHSLSEHTVKNHHGLMELHVVFADSNQDLAVIGVIYKLGSPNPFLQKLLKAGLPDKSTSAPVTIDKLNVEQAFTDTSSYYRYTGSLTTPPCSANVKWIILKQWAEMSKDQFEQFRNILGNDFRPIQAPNNRVIRSTVRRGLFGDEGWLPNR
ncbi:MAG: carbonic anhydrase family protein [Edaphobacter sp.]